MNDFVQVMIYYKIFASFCRYNVHKPLINFMAPQTSADVWSDEQR